MVVFISFEYLFQSPTDFSREGITLFIPSFVTTKFDVYRSCRYFVIACMLFCSAALVFVLYALIVHAMSLEMPTRVGY